VKAELFARAGWKQTVTLSTDWISEISVRKWTAEERFAGFCPPGIRTFHQAGLERQPELIRQSLSIIGDHRRRHAISKGQGTRVRDRQRPRHLIPRRHTGVSDER